MSETSKLISEQIMVDILDKLNNELAKYKDAEKQGLLLFLPYKVGDTVYTIQQNCSPCEKCEHGEAVNYSVGRCLETHKEYGCPDPEYYIQEHKCEGFEVSAGGIDIIEEWGYDRKSVMEPYYLTMETANKELEQK